MGQPLPRGTRRAGQRQAPGVRPDVDQPASNTKGRLAERRIHAGVAEIDQYQRWLRSLPPTSTPRAAWTASNASKISPPPHEAPASPPGTDTDSATTSPPSAWARSFSTNDRRVSTASTHSYLRAQRDATQHSSSARATCSATPTTNRPRPASFNQTSVQPALPGNRSNYGVVDRPPFLSVGVPHLGVSMSILKPKDTDLYRRRVRTLAKEVSSSRRAHRGGAANPLDVVPGQARCADRAAATSCERESAPCLSTSWSMTSRLPDLIRSETPTKRSPFAPGVRSKRPSLTVGCLGPRRYQTRELVLVCDQRVEQHIDLGGAVPFRGIAPCLGHRERHRDRDRLHRVRGRTACRRRPLGAGLPGTARAGCRPGPGRRRRTTFPRRRKQGSRLPIRLLLECVREPVQEPVPRSRGRGLGAGRAGFFKPGNRGHGFAAAHALLPARGRRSSLPIRVKIALVSRRWSSASAPTLPGMRSGR